MWDNFLRDALWGVGFLAVSALVALITFQEKLLYVPVVPGATREYPFTPDRLRMHFEDVWLTAKDGVKLHAWLLKYTPSTRGPTVLFLQENAGSILPTVNVLKAIVVCPNLQKAFPPHQLVLSKPPLSLPTALSSLSPFSSFFPILLSLPHSPLPPPFSSLSHPLLSHPHSLISNLLLCSPLSSLPSSPLPLLSTLSVFPLSPIFSQTLPSLPQTPNMSAALLAAYHALCLKNPGHSSLIQLLLNVSPAPSHATAIIALLQSSLSCDNHSSSIFARPQLPR
ncbi:unnamed protein product [Closterium sp. NIES-54]